MAKTIVEVCTIPLRHYIQNNRLTTKFVDTLEDFEHTSEMRGSRDELAMARSAKYKLLLVPGLTYLEDFVRSSKADPREEADGLLADAFRCRATEDGEV
jgi:hypothetical protein